MAKESILKEIRQCYFSCLSCSQPKDETLQPDYICDNTSSLRNNKPCILFKEPFCELREEFPDKYNS